jgi:hypothetical protein
MFNKFWRQAVIFSVVSGLIGCSSSMQSRSNQSLAASGIPIQAAPLSSAADCNIQPDSTLPQYIIGYGSLMQDESRKRTSPQAEPAHPVEISGYLRGWFARGDSVGFSTTFLGALPDSKAHLNAVIYRIEMDELKATDQRESIYCRASVPLSDIKTLEKSPFKIFGGQAWIYTNRPEAAAIPNAKFPIVQSYVDIFMSGCLEQEQRFELKGFAEQCLTTTKDWSTHWINDRPYPRRPSASQPKSRQIDTLLSQQLPEYFSHIRIE